MSEFFKCFLPLVIIFQAYLIYKHWPEDKKLTTKCPGCDHNINYHDDDAMICIECGGRNRRIKEMP